MILKKSLCEIVSSGRESSLGETLEKLEENKKDAYTLMAIEDVSDRRRRGAKTPLC